MTDLEELLTRWYKFPKALERRAADHVLQTHVEITEALATTMVLMPPTRIVGGVVILDMPILSQEVV